VDFLRQRADDALANPGRYAADVAAYLSPLAVPVESPALVKIDTFVVSRSIRERVDAILDEVRALSLLVDFPLHCQQIEFHLPPGQVDSGPVWIATRLAIGRGFGFADDEREIADRKLQAGLAPYTAAGKPELELATGYYLSGMKLLALEDDVEGLIDAAFMQFYLAAEVLLGTEVSRDASRAFARRFSVPDAIAVQRSIYQVYGVRGRYFGHAKALAAQTAQESFDIAKQVLVARWLARHLIDLHAGRQDSLTREMRLYRGLQSFEFRGTEAELRNSFMLSGIADPFAQPIFDNMGNRLP
jgi:hypothetical protein